MNKIFKIGILAVVSLLLTGCSAFIDNGLTKENAKQYHVTMVSKQQMVCGDITFPKGSVFGAKSAAGFKVHLDGEEVVFPENSVMLQGKFNDDYAFRALVYPNGKFVYKNYNTFLIIAGEIIGMPLLCKPEVEEPFEVISNY